MDQIERMRSAEAAVEEARSLIRAQEAEVTRIRLTGMDVTRAQPLSAGPSLGGVKILSDMPQPKAWPHMLSRLLGHQTGDPHDGARVTLIMGAFGRTGIQVQTLPPFVLNDREFSLKQVTDHVVLHHIVWCLGTGLNNNTC
jgi:hypothetical protein